MVRTLHQTVLINQADLMDKYFVAGVGQAGPRLVDRSVISRRSGIVRVDCNRRSTRYAVDHEGDEG
jgi:hypothetical protein